jgi:hypothetical protein
MSGSWSDGATRNISSASPASAISRRDSTAWRDGGFVEMYRSKTGRPSRRKLRPAMERAVLQQRACACLRRTEQPPVFEARESPRNGSILNIVVVIAA